MRMNRRESLKFAGIGAALIGLDGPAVSAPAENRPNIVLCMADDPQESRDRAARAPDRTKAMRAQLEAWLRSVVQSLNGKDYG
jgi:hypothetical protein